jgi:hypothetical protein
MHNLEKLITEWRKAAETLNVSDETLDELETHLRETTERLVGSGMSVPEAFQRAVAELGTMPRIASEFRKLDEPLWLPIKLAIGAIGVITFAAMVPPILVIARSGSGLSSVLLGTHIFTITLGYTMTLLIGGLGICFVSQRCFEDFPTSRLHSIRRVSLLLGTVALFFTAMGVFLGMVWAKIEWGRYWAWDSKEIGGLSAVVWLACYVSAHRFFKRSSRGVLAISMLGNIVISLAWLGPLVSGLHPDGTPITSLLLTVAVLVHLAFFAIGFVPAGRLRLRSNG